jgi:hypothetical protein
MLKTGLKTMLLAAAAMTALATKSPPGCRPEHMTLGEPGKLKLTGAVDIIEPLGESGFA